MCQFRIEKLSSIEIAKNSKHNVTKSQIKNH